jgi:uncharacterized protein (TIGR03435 family)
MDALKPGAVITPETERLLLSQCVTMIGADTTYSGASTMQQLAISLRFGGITEPIEDHTGLTGKYAYKLTFARGLPGPQQPPPDNAPSILVALQEQLGLKLEPTTVQSQAVVVDQIERPSED